MLYAIAIGLWTIYYKNKTLDKQYKIMIRDCLRINMESR